MGKDERQLPSIPMMTNERFMENHHRFVAISTLQIELRVADLRLQEEDIRQRWHTWHKTVLQKCSPLNVKFDRMRRAKQSNAAAARTAAAFKKALKWRWEKLPLFRKWDDKVPAAEVWHAFMGALSDYYSSCLLGELTPVADELRRCETHLKNRAYQARKQARAAVVIQMAPPVLDDVA